MRQEDIIGGTYKVLQKIGKGGTGEIYLGYHLHLQKYIVIKKIADSYVGRSDIRAESDILKELHHTYLPQVYDFVVTESGVYTVMDYIRGRDLQYYIDSGTRFPEETLVRWLVQLCEVLEYLHTQNPPILHSDIKPANIMITESGNICLIDFNISLDGSQNYYVKGMSNYFAAPEQYQCAMEIMNTGRSNLVMKPTMDLYSLGAVFYYTMTGVLPDVCRGVPYSIVDLDLPYSDGLKEVINKAVCMEEKKRFQTAREMKKMLEHLEKMSPKYQMLGTAQVVTWLACALLCIVGTMLIYSGLGQITQEKWSKAYSNFYKVVQTQQDPDIISEGTALLNDHSLERYLSRHSKDKGKILATIGESYFRQEQYQSAAEFYEEALTHHSDSSLYMRNYVASIARSGADFKLSEIEAKYPKAKLSQGERYYVEAQTAYGRGDWDTAISNAKQLTLLSEKSELLMDGYSVYADALEKKGEVEQAFHVYDQALLQEASPVLARKAGQRAFALGNEARTEMEKQSLYEKASKYFRMLYQREDRTYEDMMNYALALRSIRNYRESNYVLKEMSSLYSDDYKIPMWICFNILDETGNSDELNYYYNSCRHLYDVSDTTDKNMEALIQIMKERE